MSRAGRTKLPEGSGKSVRQVKTSDIADTAEPGEARPDGARRFEELVHELEALPIIVQKTSDPQVAEPFTVVAGKRLLREARRRGMKTVPARMTGDKPVQGLVRLGLQIKYGDLRKTEEIRRLVEVRKTHGALQAISNACGVARPTLSNMMRLGQLPSKVLEMYDSGSLSREQARALLKLEASARLPAALEATSLKLTGKQIERWPNTTIPQQASRGKPRKTPSSSDGQTTEPTWRKRTGDTLRLAEALSDQLAAHVQVDQAADGRGRITIDFASIEEMEGLLQRLGISEAE